VARLGAALATALHALHVQEAIHLDVKPSNVIVRPGGEAVLIDLGLAHHAHYPDLLAEEFRRRSEEIERSLSAQMAIQNADRKYVT